MSAMTAVLLVLFAVPGASDAPVAALRNPGFEDPEPLGAWRTWIYRDGREPTIRLDRDERAEGTQSLLIVAEDPADVALGQTVALPPGTVWLARCRIRTENLVAKDKTEVGGALHVQTPEGGAIAAGASHFGTSPWREVEVPFRVPAAGEVKITLFYIGYGKGTGKVWFDDVRLAELAAGAAPEVRIHAERLTRRPVDPKQCGQFVEPLCNLIPSMLAQQVASTSFEDDPPWNVAFRPEVDRPRRPWYPDGAVHVARYASDEDRPFNGKKSLRIEILAGRCRAGISQDGFVTERGTTYRLRLHLRGAGVSHARASLHGDGAIAAGPEPLGEVLAEWTPAEIRLRAERPVKNATLTIDFEGPGTLWLDRVYLIAEDAVRGLWRPDVVEAIRRMRPGILRFGGSAMMAYEWTDCLGSWDRRTPFPQPYWGGLEENFVGVEEFVQLCRDVDAEPLVCVRWTGKKPEDAAAQVEYFNGSAETRWGSLRAKNGHPEPYGVRYWQIGNEVSGLEYEASVRAFCEAMRRVDPSILLLSSFPSRAVMENAGDLLHYLCPHHYGCADLQASEASFAELEEEVRSLGHGRDIRVAVTEWNTTAADWGLGRNALQTLGNGLSCARYHNLLHRRADLVEIAVRSNLIDSFCSGAIVTGPGWLHVTPAYLAQELYSRGSGSHPVRIERRESVPLPPHLAEPDLSALLSSDGKTLRVYAVNSTALRIEVKTSLAGFGERPRGPSAGTGGGAVSRHGMLHVLRDSSETPSPETSNSRDEPERVRVTSRELDVTGDTFSLSSEPFSLTLLELQIGD